jgi:cytochrome c biogenesis protein CcmG/thiol:disulfide interchange protein DsbE
VPETYFIDRGGIVRYKSAGPVTPQLLGQELSRLTRKGT